MDRPIEIDLFADTNNAKVAQFAAKFHCPNALIVDAFSLSWDGRCAWICPPPSIVIDVLKKIAHSTAMSGALVVPYWPTATYWPFLFPDGQHLAASFRHIIRFRPYILSGETVTDQRFILMKGRTPFPFLACYIATTTHSVLDVSDIPIPMNDSFII